jgi:hypothetical protein
VKYLITLSVAALFLPAADIKSLPNQAGNGDIDLSGSAIVDSKEIQQLLGAPMQAGYVVVRIKVSPRTAQAIRISADDFTLVSRKDGERSPALVPSQIGGPANLDVKAKTTYASSAGVGITSVTVAPVESKVDSQKAADSPLIKILESKMLADTETKDPVEGLLYFLLEGKNKPKDLGLLYKGPAGRLAMDFK